MTINKPALDKLSDLVKNQGEKQQDRSGLVKLLAGIGIGLLAIGTIAFLYYRLWKQSRELAKLRHERDLAAERINQAKLKKEVEGINKSIKVIDLATDKAQKELKKLDDELLKTEIKTNETKKTIDDISNWRDLDNYLRK